MSALLKNSLEEELRCPICLSVFIEPVQLPCMHNFCKGCISGAWATDRGAVQCPECNHRYQPKPALKEDFQLAKIVKQLSLFNTERPTAETQCVLCGQAAPALPVRKFCLRCKEPCCEAHVQRHLQQPCAAPGHLLVDAEELTAWTCPIHNEYKQFYCEDEQEALCTFCFMAQCSTKGHKVSYAEPQHVQTQDTLRRTDRLVNHVKDIDEQLTRLEAHKTGIKEKLSELELSVRGQYERMHRLLEVNQAGTILGLESTYAEFERSHSLKVQQLVERRKGTEKYVDAVERFIKDSDNINFMKNTDSYHMLMDRSGSHLTGVEARVSLGRLHSDHLLSVLLMKEKNLKIALEDPFTEAPILKIRRCANARRRLRQNNRGGNTAWQKKT